jgi:hypothetical protein
MDVDLIFGFCSKFGKKVLQLNLAKELFIQTERERERERTLCFFLGL